MRQLEWYAYNGSAAALKNSLLLSVLQKGLVVLARSMDSK